MHARCKPGHEPFRERRYEMVEAVAPDVLMSEIIKCGLANYVDHKNLVVHLVPDTHQDTLAELTLASKDGEGTFSAWCLDPGCNRRVETDDGECACYKCGGIVLCMNCHSSILAGNTENYGEDYCSFCQW